jgi:hypothetical protein
MNLTKIPSSSFKVSFSNIEKREIDVETFLKYPEVPMQRDTEGRAQTTKVKKMLSGKVLPVHLDVALVELTEDDIYYNVKYEKGYTAVVNGCTRRFYWDNGLSENIPEKVHATIYKCKNMNEVREIYNTFDSPDATERKKEKLHGILSGLFDFIPRSSKLQKGEFLSALNFSCHTLNYKEYSQPSSSVDQLPHQVKCYIDEIKAFDMICQNPKKWDQALVAAAFMSLKVYGTNNEKLLRCLDRIDKRQMNTMVSKRDGATHICVEWDTNARFIIKGTGWDKPGGLKQTVSFALYWIKNFMIDNDLTQPGFNWESTAKEWFNEHNKLNRNLSKLFNAA